VCCETMYAAEATLMANKNTHKNVPLLLLDMSVFNSCKGISFFLVPILVDLEATEAAAVLGAVAVTGCDVASLNDFRNEFPVALPPLTTFTDDAVAIVVCGLFAGGSIELLLVATDAAGALASLVLVVEDPPLLTCFAVRDDFCFFFATSSSEPPLDDGFDRFAMLLLW
jgi:hypothetical protein